MALELRVGQLATSGRHLTAKSELEKWLTDEGQDRKEEEEGKTSHDKNRRKEVSKGGRGAETIKRNCQGSTDSVQRSHNKGLSFLNSVTSLWELASFFQIRRGKKEMMGRRREKTLPDYKKGTKRGRKQNMPRSWCSEMCT